MCNAGYFRVKVQASNPLTTALCVAKGGGAASDWDAEGASCCVPCAPGYHKPLADARGGYAPDGAV